PAEDARWPIDGATSETVGTLAADEGLPLLDLTDERASLEQADLDLPADEAPFAASPTSTRQEA
nr:ABC transporter ATP-binding protein [Streptomyces sp. DSM 41633]